MLKRTFSSLCKRTSCNLLKACLQNLFVLFYRGRKMCKSRSQGYLETVAVVQVLFLNLKYFAGFCPSAPSFFLLRQCLKNSSKYFICDTTGNLSSTLEQELVLLLICKEPVVESSDPVVGSLEVLLVCRAFAEGRDFGGLQD